MKQVVGELHKAFESRIRLGIMSILAVNHEMDFTSMRDALEATDGNLATHLRALESEGFIEVKKSFIGRKPNTRYSITESGKVAFEHHIKVLEQLIKNIRDF